MEIIIPVPDGDYRTAYSIMRDIESETGYACYIGYDKKVITNENKNKTKHR